MRNEHTVTNVPIDIIIGKELVPGLKGEVTFGEYWDPTTPGLSYEVWSKAGLNTHIGFKFTALQIAQIIRFFAGLLRNKHADH